MIELDDFKATVLAFLERTGISRSDLGRHVCHDPSFVSDLLDGREPKLSTIKKVLSWMALYDRAPDEALGKVSAEASKSAA